MARIIHYDFAKETRLKELQEIDKLLAEGVAQMKTEYGENFEEVAKDTDFLKQLKALADRGNQLIAEELLWEVRGVDKWVE